MAPAATSSAAPAIPNKDRRGSDVPLMLPIPVTTCSRDRRFKGVYNGTDAAWMAGIGLLQCVAVELLIVNISPDTGRGGPTARAIPHRLGRDRTPGEFRPGHDAIPLRRA